MMPLERKIRVAAKADSQTVSFPEREADLLLLTRHMIAVVHAVYTSQTSFDPFLVCVRGISAMRFPV
jgi:hypothetical protein